MTKKTANFISIILHPLLMPTYFFIFIIFYASSLMQPFRQGALLSILLVIFITTFIIPVLSISSMRTFGLISDLNLFDRKQRMLPFLFVTAFYGVTAYMFYAKIHLNDLILVTFTSVTFLLLVLLIISYFWKISIHSAAVGGMTGFLFAMQVLILTPSFLYPIAIMTALTGVVMSARLKLNAHTPMQVYAGALIGFVVCFFALYYFL